MNLGITRFVRIECIIETRTQWLWFIEVEIPHLELASLQFSTSLNCYINYWILITGRIQTAGQIPSLFSFIWIDFVKSHIIPSLLVVSLLFSFGQGIWTSDFFIEDIKWSLYLLKFYFYDGEMWNSCMSHVIALYNQ